MIKIRIFKDIDNLNLKKDWNYLFNKLNFNNQNNYLYSFLNYEIVKIWFDIYDPSKTLINIISIYKNDKPIIIIPLIKYNFLFLSIYKIMGGLEFDYKNILVDYDEMYFDKILIYQKIRSIFGANYFFIIDGMNDKYTYRFFKGLFKYKFFIKKDVSSFFIPNNGIIPKKLKKRIAKFKLANKVSYQKIMKKDKNFDLVMRKLFFLKNEQYKKSNSSLMPFKRKKFYLDLAKTNISHLSCTLIGNDLAAIHLGLLSKNNFVYLLPAYDNAFYKDSPGWIHIDYLLSECLNLKINKFDLTIGNEGYKKRISTNTNNIYTLIGSDFFSIFNLYIVRFYYYLKDLSLFKDLKFFIRSFIRIL